MTVELAPSHRERKKLATRQAIHEAAFDLVERLGWSGVTVEAISQQAGVAPRTFWAYFSSKEEAVVDWDPGRAEQLRLALLERPVEEDPLTALHRILEDDLLPRMTDRDKALRRFCLIRRDSQLRAAVAANFDEVEQALVSAVAERMGRDPETDMLPGVMVSAAIGACRVVQLRWTGRKGRPSLPELLDEGFAHLAAGLAPHLLDEPAVLEGTRG